jgi:hypothetical protein
MTVFLRTLSLVRAMSVFHPSRHSPKLPGTILAFLSQN